MNYPDVKLMSLKSLIPVPRETTLTLLLSKNSMPKTVEYREGFSAMIDPSTKVSEVVTPSSIL